MNLELLQEKILSWYEKNGRKELPWRYLARKKGKKFLDPKLKAFDKLDRAYLVYISEIMLQQTQVKRVLEHFYFPFLEEFPNLKSLAKADEQRLLKAWQGLGYYHRARNLKKCAKTCVLNFKAKLPKELKELERLSGIGSYTARAIACFAYEEALGFVDGNISRVLSRFFALENPSLKELQARADELLNPKNAFDHNQALLDIGALICTPKKAQCKLCPLNEACKGKNEPLSYPQSKKKNYENLDLALFILNFEDKIAVLKSKEALYKNLYNFPFDRLENCELEDMSLLAQFKHSYTKFKLNVKIFYQILKERDQRYEFKRVQDLQKLALSNLSLKALELFKKDEISKNLYRT
ncbi:A/G-specific adenine glycosylase [Campylobacter sp. MIT 99-7217]|uniref:A/G-specific adenine glycosylase n=1 Tax=Campylobacter sp. MIT 99-7217 TaxID=535091 RepID=UPI0011574F9D|nr:A/G-specific adenine glycosylase [Campylobacter sp. MIT 99-7217]TQR32336.1 A/G-specific adenine glycosylase [Campylobacter sp. MIT 99-7217]